LYKHWGSVQAVRRIWGVQVWLYPFMTTALEGGEGSGSRPGRSLFPGKTRCPLYRRLGGPQDRSGQVRKISPPTGIRSPDRPARSQSLYRLRYPDHITPISPLSYTRLIELRIFGSGDEEEIPVEATNRSPDYQTASTHFTDRVTAIARAVQSLEGRLRY
jgi:hypothetical protein